MAKEDYVASGGKFKLKGVQDGKIDKKHKKKKRKPQAVDVGETVPIPDHVVTESSTAAVATVASDVTPRPSVDAVHAEVSHLSPDERSLTAGLQKTEAQRRHEEAKRRRMQERLRREGKKSHKEKVEDFNRYLSTLSEHHDMPRIGPG